MNDELKACPFCGSTDIQMSRIGKTKARIHCHSCNADRTQRTLHYSQDWLLDVMPKAWNQRPLEDTLLARAERAEADLAMAEARCSFLHNENKQLDGLVVERGRMVERLIETGNKIHNVLPDVNVGSRIDRNWQALIAEWSKEHGNVT